MTLKRIYLWTYPNIIVVFCKIYEQHIFRRWFGNAEKMNLNTLAINLPMLISPHLVVFQVLKPLKINT